MWLFGRKKKAAKEAEAKRLEDNKKAEEAQKLEEVNKSEEKKQEESNKAIAPISKTVDAHEENPDKTEPKKELKKVYHVVKRQKDNKWCVKLEGSTRAIKLFDNKVEALEYCEKLANNQNGTLKVHASKGKNKGRIQSN